MTWKLIIICSPILLSRWFGLQSSDQAANNIREKPGFSSPVSQVSHGDKVAGTIWHYALILVCDTRCDSPLCKCDSPHSCSSVWHNTIHITKYQCIHHWCDVRFLISLQNAGVQTLYLSVVLWTDFCRPFKCVVTGINSV